MAVDTTWSFTSTVLDATSSLGLTVNVDYINEPALSIGCYFNITEIHTVTPTDNIKLRTVFNEFDEHGLINGLRRIPGEKNATFKRRILDVFVHRSNSTYRGLVNGITRELGLSLFYPLLIRPKRNNDLTFLATDPYVVFDGKHD